MTFAQSLAAQNFSEDRLSVTFDPALDVREDSIVNLVPVNTDVSEKMEQNL